MHAVFHFTAGSLNWPGGMSSRARAGARERFPRQLQTTPVNDMRSFGSKRRRLGASDIINQIDANSPGQSFYTPRCGNSGGVYQPHQSLYDGIYHSQQEDSDGSDSPDSENFRVNTATGPTSMELVKMMQEQHQLLQQVVQTQKELVETQKTMQLRHEEYEVKIEDISKHLESSSSSPDGSQKKKVKISRKLTVSC